MARAGVCPVGDSSSETSSGIPRRRRLSGEGELQSESSSQFTRRWSEALATLILLPLIGCCPTMPGSGAGGFSALSSFRCLGQKYSALLLAARSDLLTSHLAKGRAVFLGGGWAQPAGGPSLASPIHSLPLSFLYQPVPFLCLAHSFNLFSICVSLCPSVLLTGVSLPLTVSSMFLSHTLPTLPARRRDLC